MKKRVAGITAMVVVLLCSISTVFAASRTQTNQEVLAVKDVTRAFHYSITYRTYNQEHQLISTKKVVPKKGSLVEFVKEPMSNAVANGDVYARIGKTETKAQLHKEFGLLHKKLYQKLHGTSSIPSPLSNAAIQSVNTTSNVETVSYEPISTAATTTDATGTFTDYNGNTWAYDATYSSSSGNVTVSGYDIYQSQGTASSVFDDVRWNSTTYYPFASGTAIPKTYPGLDDTGLYWQNPSGYNLTSVITEGSTAYEGWVALS